MKVRWTRLALDDLNQAREFIEAENPAAAEKVIERIKKAVSFLSRHSELGRGGRVAGTRELIVPGTPFVLPYRVSKTQVEILALIHGARRWPDTF